MRYCGGRTRKFEQGGKSMKLKKLGRLVVAAIATLFGTGILAKGSGQVKGIDSSSPSFPKLTQNLFVYADTVIGFLPGVTDPADICVESNRYSLGQEIVWRIRVLDGDQQRMDDKHMNSVVVKIPGGPTLNAHYEGHPGGPGATPTDYFWSVAWTIPLDYPTGTFPYQVVATAYNGLRMGTFEDFNIFPSLLTIVP
jgi:hypothetical protein